MGRENILSSVNERKAENARQTLKDLEKREWSRDTFIENFEKVKSEISSIDNNISELDEEIDRLLGREDGVKSEFERVREEVGEQNIKEVENTALGNNHYAGVKTFEELYEQLADLRKKREEWKAFQLELSRLAARKMYTVASTFRDEFKSSEVAEDVLKYTQNRMEDKFEKLETDLEAKIERRTSKLESAVEAARTEAKFYRDYFERFGELTVESLGSLADTRQFEEHVDKADESEFGELAGDDGTVDLSSQDVDQDSEPPEEELEQVNQISSSGESSSQVKYKIEGKEVHEQMSVLQDIVDSEDVEEMSKAQIAELTDVTRQALFDPDGIVDRVYDAVGTAFGLEEL